MSCYRVSMHRVTEIEIGSVGKYGFDFIVTSTLGGENSYETLDIFNEEYGKTSEELKATRKLLINLQSSIEDSLKELNSKLEEALKDES